VTLTAQSFGRFDEITYLVEEAADLTHHRRKQSWLRFLRQRDKWQLRPIQARISLERKEIYDEAIPPQSFCGI
jgi:hypothetical protein